MLIFGATGQAATITPVQSALGGEPDLTEILDDVYGVGGYYRIDDSLDAGWTAGQITVRAIGSYSSALANLGYCIICDGSDDVYSDQTFAGEGALSTPLTFGGSGSLIIPSSYSWFNFAQFLPFVGQVYSTAALNIDGTDHAVTYGVYGQPNTIVLAFEDWFFDADPPSDGEYQDLVLEVTYLTAPPQFLTPEPGALFTLAGGLVALVAMRRKRVIA
jgi:hypothetical protein